LKSTTFAGGNGGGRLKVHLTARRCPRVPRVQSGSMAADGARMWFLTGSLRAGSGVSA
jgi:hypothetical protein